MARDASQRNCGTVHYGQRLAGGKFNAWAATVPYTLRNPLYHWTHLELAREFGITRLGEPPKPPATSGGRPTRYVLAIQPACSRPILLARHQVRVLCMTTDDPADLLEHHQAIREEQTQNPRLSPPIARTKPCRFTRSRRV